MNRQIISEEQLHNVVAKGTPIQRCWIHINTRIIILLHIVSTIFDNKVNEKRNTT